MTETQLEVTITHNLKHLAEVIELFSRRWIALDWGRKGQDPAAYTGRAKTDVRLFHEMRSNGAATLAAYKGATKNPSDRIIGQVERGAHFERLNGLLCLPLSSVRIVDSAASFLGNLAPRRCTVQRCHQRSKGRLLSWVLGEPPERSVWSLHHLDVEWLVTNFLISAGLCCTVWSGCRAYESIDHAGVAADGKEVLAQTTVSQRLVATKAAQLLDLQSKTRRLVMFGPEAARSDCPAEIGYYSIESVFSDVERTPAGRWLIDRMLHVDSIAA